MTLRAVTDTHTIIWHIFADERLSTTAREFIEDSASHGDEVGFSSITLAEIVYLTERGRIPQGTVEHLLNAVDSELAVLIDLPFDRNVAETMQHVDRSQIPDLPDRIIAATALYYGVPLISRDRKIQLSSISTLW